MITIDADGMVAFRMTKAEAWVLMTEINAVLHIAKPRSESFHGKSVFAIHTQPITDLCLLIDATIDGDSA